MMRKSTKRVTRTAVLTAAALILTLVENWLPPLFVFAPGTKLGLSNACVLFALIVCGVGDAAVILSAKCLLGALFAGNPFALVYSVPAGISSFAVQFLLYRFLFPKVKLISISLAGAIMHNLSQLFIASLVVQVNLFYLLPLTLAASVLAGLFVGAAVHYTVKFLPKKIIGPD